MADPAKRPPANLERAEASPGDLLKVFGERLWLIHEERRIREHALPVAPAQQAPNWLPRCLAQDVPERDIDAADGMREAATASEPEGVLMQLLADALRLQGVFAPVQWLKVCQRGSHQPGVGENAANAGGALIRAHDHKGVDAVFWPQFIAPATLWRGSRQANCLDFANAHAVCPCLGRVRLASSHIAHACVRLPDSLVVWTTKQET